MEHRGGGLGPIYVSKYYLCAIIDRLMEKIMVEVPKSMNIPPDSRMGGDMSSSVKNVLLGKNTSP